MHRWVYRTLIALTGMLGLLSLFTAMVLFGAGGPRTTSSSTPNHFTAHVSYTQIHVIGGYHTNDPPHLGFVFLIVGIVLVMPLGRVLASAAAGLWYGVPRPE